MVNIALSICGQMLILCKPIVLEQAIAGRRFLLPDAVGRHWSPACEITAGAVNWRASFC
jgi:hypothetical protein